MRLHELDDHLRTIAEIAITLAGFSGLVAAIRGTEAWSRMDGIRIVTIVALCFVVVACALLPGAIGFYAVEPETPYRVACLVFGIFESLILSGFLIAAQRNEGGFAMPAFSLPLFTVAVGIVIVSFAAALDVGIRANPGLLVMLMLWGLVQAGVSFLLSLRLAWTQDES